jgi:hypothetical protein
VGWAGCDGGMGQGVGVGRGAVLHKCKSHAVVARLMAESLEVSERTVWRCLAAAERDRPRRGARGVVPEQGPLLRPPGGASAAGLVERLTGRLRRPRSRAPRFRPRPWQPAPAPPLPPWSPAGLLPRRHAQPAHLRSTTTDANARGKEPGPGRLTGATTRGRDEQESLGVQSCRSYSDYRLGLQVLPTIAIGA